MGVIEKFSHQQTKLPPQNQNYFIRPKITSSKPKLFLSRLGSPGKIENHFPRLSLFISELPSCSTGVRENDRNPEIGNSEISFTRAINFYFQIAFAFMGNIEKRQKSGNKNKVYIFFYYPLALSKFGEKCTKTNEIRK